MAQPVIQSSFNSGEWSPHLYSRVDLTKFHSGLALAENWFVDYRGGASTRPGTKYILQAKNSNQNVRLIPFQAEIDVGYVLEFGHNYIRPLINAAYVLESSGTITAVTKASPCVVSVVNTYAVGDWVRISSIVGMTQLNGNYYIVKARTNGSISLTDLFGNDVDSTGFTTYVSGGITKRVYTISSPFTGPDIPDINFVQNVDRMILVHPSYQPQELRLITATNWTIDDIVFGSGVDPPENLTVATTLPTDVVYYSYVATAVDKFGQESGPSNAGKLSKRKDLREVAGNNTISWDPVDNAESYNVYRASYSYKGPVPDGSVFGYIGNTTGNSFIDDNIEADFSISPPVPQAPFATGSSVESVTMTARGNYTTIPNVTFANSDTGIRALGYANMRIRSIVLNTGGANYTVGDILTLDNCGGATISVDSIDGAGAILTFTLLNKGNLSTLIPNDPVSSSGAVGVGAGATFNLTWEIKDVILTNGGGNGYASVPAITFSSGAGAATAVLGDSVSTRPSVVAFFQQRLCFAAADSAVQTLWMSRTGAPYNFDKSIPSQEDDAITATLALGQLNRIRSMIPQPAGLLVLADSAAFLINGGSAGAAVSPSSITANAQSFNGASPIQPIVSNYDVLYVQSKGSSVRDSSYNFYANVFTGTDISVLASHLFYRRALLGWCWAEEPFKVVWAVRDDGSLLSLTFIKEQEFTAWCHSDTLGSFKSIATVVESISGIGNLNAVYAVVDRVIGGQTWKYIERMDDRQFNTLSNSWCVDCGIQYDGAPATTFSGAQHLAGLTVTGLADGVVIPPFVMPANGSFVLAPAATVVTVGLGFTCDMKTLPIDLSGSDSTVQSKRKKIPAVTARCYQTSQLKVGTDFNNLVPMDDTVQGNVGSCTNELLVGLLSGDARQTLDPAWQEIGQFVFRQDLPLPATITGVFPEVATGDTPK